MPCEGPIVRLPPYVRNLSQLLHVNWWVMFVSLSRAVPISTRVGKTALSVVELTKQLWLRGSRV